MITLCKFLLPLLVLGNMFYYQFSSHSAAVEVLKEKPYSRYISGDIAHIDSLTVTFEVSSDSLIFCSRDDLNQYLEDQSAYATSIQGYAGDLDYLIRNGYVFARTVFNEDEQYTDLIYKGPNWTVDATRDTSFIISTFNTVEELYNPITKAVEFDSYTID
jgi:hypothetical protein